VADIRETAKAEAGRRYARDEWTNGPGNRPVRFRSRAAEDAFVAGALWAWRARGEADAEAVRWLAKARAEYCHLPHEDQRALINSIIEGDRGTQALHTQHETAEQIADMLDGSNDGMGWLPSWRWDEWAAIRALDEGGQ